MRSDVNRGSALLGTERPRSTRHWHTIKCRNSQCDCNSECRAHNNNYNNYNNYNYIDDNDDCTYDSRPNNSGAVSNGIHFDNFFIFKHDFNVND